MMLLEESCMLLLEIMNPMRMWFVFGWNMYVCIEYLNLFT